MDSRNAALLSRGAWALCMLLHGTAFSDGLPGEYLLTPRWREHLAEYSPAANPAYLATEDYIGVRVAFAPVLQGEFLLGELGVTVPLGLYQSVGVTVLGEDDGDVDAGVIDPYTGELVRTGETITNQNLLVMFTYAVNPWRKLSLGVNVNVAYQTNFGHSLAGLGLDVGAAYCLLRHPVYGNHTVGFFLQNLIPPSMSDEGLSFNTDAVGNYTGGVKLSWIGTFLEDRVSGGIDLYLKDLFWNSGEFTDFNSAVKTAEAIEWSLAARAGVWLFHILEVRAQLGFGDDVVDYWGIAGGVNIPSVNAGRDLQMLYQYNLKTEGDAASTHTIYIRADLGRHREEQYAKNLAKRMSIAPNELYNQAMALFEQGMYWDAYFVFSQIVMLYPDFFKNDRVSYFRGRCLQMLDMREESRKLYEYTIREFERSNIVPFAEMGMVEYCYKEGKYEEQLNHYLKLNRADTPDSVRHHGDYLMGEALLQQDRVRDALAVFDKVPPTHPEYVFARHSGAIACFLLQDYAAGRERLEDAVNVVAKTPAQTEMVQRSFVMLGYMFYELQSLAEAISVLRRVPSTSAYYAEALLGQAWTALRARQWSDCRVAAQTLNKTSSDPALQEEANLLVAYTHMLQSEFAPALSILQESSKRLDTLGAPRPDELRVAEATYERDRFSYDSLAGDVVRRSLLQSSPQNQRVVDSMHVSQVKWRGKLEDFYLYRDAFKKRTFFARSLERVKSDVNYALAVAQRSAGRQGLIDAQKKAVEKQQQLDAEIEKLKQQMQNLDSE